MWETIITALISLLSVVVGWLLNNLSHKGKLTIYGNDTIGASFHTREELPSSSKETTECFSYNIFLDVYNSSGDIQIMRDIKIAFFDKAREIKVDIPNDNKKTTHSPAGNIYYPVEIINIPAKTAIKLNLYNYFWDEDMRFIWNVNSVKLYYKDKDNKQRTKVLEIKDYAQHLFEDKEQNNG